MIQTFAEFLEALKSHYEKKMPSFSEVQHPGMFGDMYEGLTQELLSKAVPQGADLRVVSGKARNSKGRLSKQLDCMVVHGDGERLPFTDHYIYPVDRVVMIVEVKKTLYADELGECMDLFQQYWADVSEPMLPRTRILDDAWRTICGTRMPAHENVENLPLHLQMVYHSLLIESFMPLRVVIGYEGYTDEWTFREGVTKWIDSKVGLPYESRYRFNLNTFPNLVICRQSCIAKMDGLPYAAPIREDGYLCWFVSRSGSSMRTLLEMLWTRLVPLVGADSSIFGDDLEIESANPFLFAKAMPANAVGKPDKVGWMFECWPLSARQLRQGNRDRPWTPTELDDSEMIAMQILCREGRIDTTTEAFRDFAGRRKLDLDGFAAKLSRDRLASMNGSMIELLTEKCVCIILPDGRNLTGEDKTGRVTRYAMKEAERLQKQRDSKLEPS